MAERLLRLPAVLSLVPWCRSTLYAKVKAGEFPPPVTLGARSVAWRESEVSAWIDGRPEALRRAA
ncbi:MAG: AlpA family phage regulatory protein [Thermodesulfobacteriota bacterium]